jgi:hypothetical protein
MLAQLARRIRAYRAAQVGDGGPDDFAAEEDDDGDGGERRLVIGEDCQVQ